MKRILKALAVSILAFSAFGVMSCKDAIVDDGTNVKSYVSSSGGAGGAVPFHMFADKFDYQVWDTGSSVTTVNSKEDLSITPLDTSKYWGIAVCTDSSLNDEKTGQKYNVENVKKITFSAKGSVDGLKLYVSGCDKSGGKLFTLTDEYEEYETDEISLSGTHYSLVWLIANEGISQQGTWYIKNIAFFDASGNEIVPTVSK
ncbi:hypothetical protein DYE49_08295 [Treponema rectale]|uniref:Lipoprotein n=1 Tax=Treponema rectale TaxID=744512 RepID=A0A840SCC8_9SPIR|nr:hypothetical protein [Treponema rectale]MBB5217818.1 hypothetical protein [Treponema rectale]QOS40455.1 hypothetical protein DYE49_08295 [Treponema rectale]